MPKNSRRKGARAEVEAAKLLESLGLGPARRGQQHSGVEAQDVIHSIPGVWLEVKRQETTQLYPWLEQAKRDAICKSLGGSAVGKSIVRADVSVVLHRRNRKPWVFVVEAEDVVEFAQAIVDALRREGERDG